MAADGAGGVGVGTAGGFVVGGPVVVPVVVEEGVNGIGLDSESADDGDLEVATRGRAPRPSDRTGSGHGGGALEVGHDG